MSFQKTIIKIALFGLIIFAIFLSIILYNAKSSLKFPPEIALCPDHWENIGGNKCQNVNNLGDFSKNGIISFDDEKYKGQTGLCKKREWAKRNNVFWGGITDIQSEKICN